MATVNNEASPAAPSKAVLISIDNLSMTYRGASPALERLNFAVAAGEFVSLVGPSGCGKSTLLRIVAGLVDPTGGEALVAGQSPRQARQSVQMSFVFQDATLLPWRTAQDNVVLPLEIAGLKRSARNERARSTLEMVGLTEFIGHRPAELSGGMRMRVSLARALATDPGLLLLDEPFGALDDLTRQSLNEQLLALWQRHGWTALFVTHNLAEAAFLSTRIIVLSARPGTIVADVPVPFGEARSPELRADAEFARFVGHLVGLLRKGRT